MAGWRTRGGSFVAGMGQSDLASKGFEQEGADAVAASVVDVE